jgi:hypothetical protein
MAITVKRSGTAKPADPVTGSEPQTATKRQPSKPKGAKAKEPVGRVRVLTRKEGREYFDREARKTLGISGDEFLRRLDAGEYREIPDDPEHWPIIRLSMLTGFAR